MKHLCSVCEKIFRNRDAVIKISNGMVYNADSAYIGLEESFNDEDIIHSDCLKGYANPIVEIEHPETANPTTARVQTLLSDDRTENAIAGLKAFGVSHSRAVEGVGKMLMENPELETADILSGFKYGE